MPSLCSVAYSTQLTAASTVPVSTLTHAVILQFVSRANRTVFLKLARWLLANLFDAPWAGLLLSNPSEGEWR